MDDEDSPASLDIFQEPAEFYQPDKPPSFVTYTLKGGSALHLRLVGHSPLWVGTPCAFLSVAIPALTLRLKGHLLWNAGQVISQYLEDNAESLVRDKTVLELGAGAGLPSLVATTLGARQVVVTDYPDEELIVNLRYNIEHCLAPDHRAHIAAEGYLWGTGADSIKAHLCPESEGFDVLILADILFNHSEHAKLLETVRNCLKKSQESQALVFFTPYRPWLLGKDLDFFALAQADGFVVTKLSEQIMGHVMFEDDPGDENLRKTVFGYQLKWKV
jgi:EEF1A N-terminal glycine/lysine methyltransferase